MARELLSRLPAGTILRVHQIWSDDNQAGRELLGGTSLIAVIDGFSDECADITWVPDPANPDEEALSLTRMDDNDEFDILHDDEVEDWVWAEIAKVRLIA